MECYHLEEGDRELIQAALDTLRRGANDWKHTVGAAVRCRSGRIYSGVNVDAYIHASCAEVIALGAAASDGEHDYTVIVAVKEESVWTVIPPCGNCRQLLMDYAPNLYVIVAHPNHGPVRVLLRDLLPVAWTPS